MTRKIYLVKDYDEGEIEAAFTTSKKANAYMKDMADDRISLETVKDRFGIEATTLY